MAVTVLIGTSGWQYRDWRGRFYPQKLPQRLWLEHYAQHFATVESNNALYRLLEKQTFEKWRGTPPPHLPLAGAHPPPPALRGGGKPTPPPPPNQGAGGAGGAGRPPDGAQRRAGAEARRR